MGSRMLPALFALAGVVVAVGLFLVLKEDTADEDATVSSPPQESAAGHPPGEGTEHGRNQKPELPLIEIEGGQPVGGVQELEFKAGDEVKIDITADAADEVHLHGYDLTLPIPAGEIRTLAFEATLDGGYELESHLTGAPLANIAIVPD